MKINLYIVTALLFSFTVVSQEISDTSFGKGMLNFVAKDSTFSIKFAPRFQVRSMSSWDHNGESYNSPDHNFIVRRARLKFDGFAYSLGANFNAVPLSSSYGADISISFAQGSGLEGNSNVTNALGANVEVDSTSMVLALRPFTKLGGNIVFADLGYSYGKSELNIA